MWGGWAPHSFRKCIIPMGNVFTSHSTKGAKDWWDCQNGPSFHWYFPLSFMHQGVQFVFMRRSQGVGFSSHPLCQWLQTHPSFSFEFFKMLDADY